MWGGIRFFEGRIASVRELRDRAGIEHASPLDLHSWRVVRAPCPLDLCPLYVIRSPRCSPRCSPWYLVRAARAVGRARWSGSSWHASRGPGRAGSRAADRARWSASRGSGIEDRGPWSVVRGPRAASRGSRGGGRGPKNAPVLQRPRPKLDFTHWMCCKIVLVPRETSPTPWEGKPPPLINLSTRAKICANFYATDF